MSKNILIIDFDGYNDSMELRKMVRNKAGFAWLYGDAEIKDRSTMKEICSCHKVNGIIILGGPMWINSKHAEDIIHWTLSINVPRLGICYGMYLLGRGTDYKLERGTRQGYRKANLKFTAEAAKSKLFKNVQDQSGLYLSNGDSLVEIPSQFRVTAGITGPTSRTIVAFENDSDSTFGIQFCPEARDTKYGSTIVNNFVNICREHGKSAGIA